MVYVLPVEAGTGTTYGDGLLTVRNAGLQTTYQAIFVSPTFSAKPWYADHARLRRSGRKRISVRSSFRSSSTLSR